MLYISSSGSQYVSLLAIREQFRPGSVHATDMGVSRGASEILFRLRQQSMPIAQLLSGDVYLGRLSLLNASPVPRDK